jgi:hypothetical protein
MLKDDCVLLCKGVMKEVLNSKFGCLSMVSVLSSAQAQAGSST